ncbi:MAG: hypothetical protein QOH68_4339 [Nocardioidaceae bacterium]|nr:hypothetical protein [Nocardioidaceae bacterium]
MTRTNGLGRADVARCWASFASLGAGLVHLAVVQEHLEEWWLYGVFFAVIGAAQIGWAVAALASDRVPFLRTVMYGNLAVVALWAVTRTVGLPVGPEPWQAEAVGRADVLCALLEIAVAGALVVAARSVARRVPAGRPVGRVVALLFAGALAVSAMTTPALAATPAGGQAHHHFESH